jgi:DNA polymerase delta subunit 2
MAPTAPDTLWCHPYLREDPFIITETPDIYIVGGQKKFGTKMVSDPQEAGSKLKRGSSPRCRIVMVPSFSRTGILVLINLRTLDVKCVNFSVMGMTSGPENSVKVEASDIDLPSPTPVEPLSSAPKPSDSPKFM